MKDEALLSAVQECLASPTLMGALAELLKRDDASALQALREQARPGSHEVATQVLQHNERFRDWFRAASPDKDPFNG